MSTHSELPPTVDEALARFSIAVNDLFRAHFNAYGDIGGAIRFRENIVAGTNEGISGVTQDLMEEAKEAQAHTGGLIELGLKESVLR